MRQQAARSEIIWYDHPSTFDRREQWLKTPSKTMVSQIRKQRRSQQQRTLALTQAILSKVRQHQTPKEK